MRIHKRLIDILEPTPKTVDSLMRLELPAGVEVETQVMSALLQLAAGLLGIAATHHPKLTTHHPNPEGSAMNAILGKKLGMTQVFDDQARAIPVTVIKAGPCRVVQIKTDGDRRLRLDPDLIS